MNRIILLLFLLLSEAAFTQSTAGLDSLTKVLEVVYQDDQTLRLQIDSIHKTYGYDSKESLQLWKSIAENDSLNLQKVSSILDKYGWLSKEQTSENANTALFLVIQHSELPVQLKYMDILRDAANTGKASKSEYALLLDRTRMYQGKLQLYGSQVIMNHSLNCYFFPIDNEPEVNERRQQVGLSRLEDYAKLFNFKYSLPRTDAYKNRFIVYGFVSDSSYTYLQNVGIYSQGKLLATTDENGYYMLKLRRKQRKVELSYDKTAYRRITLTIEPSEQKDVYDRYVILEKEPVNL